MMYSDQMDPAFPGMKVDSRDDLVESFPVGADLGFGLVCGKGADGLLVPGAGTKVAGISLQTHTIPFNVNKYVKTDCASILRRGGVWAVVTPGASATNEGPVKFANDGTVSDNGGNALPNAVFRSDKVTLVNGAEIAWVELHNPFA
ncbi:structural cement protein Gp24 [Cupriavidus alkaliphilus]|uniref:structural cement protein Gp24 n=1 Tax=Cupriavidus alkaliphilus TaxID=942866 RepID=UPI001796B8BF|nr:hypothetical protein [Cupriavidus alkaliphilus]MBB2918325.1 hypothetical protein [Cupriavidus alkaliphilus]